MMNKIWAYYFFFMGAMIAANVIYWADNWGVESRQCVTHLGCEGVKCIPWYLGLSK